MEGQRGVWGLPMDSSSGAPSCTLGRHGISRDLAILPMGTPKALSPADDRAGPRQPSHRSIRPSGPPIPSPVSRSPTKAAIQTSIATRALWQSTPANAVVL